MSPGSTEVVPAPQVQPAGVRAFGAPVEELFRDDDVLLVENGHRYTHGDRAHSHAVATAGLVLCKPGHVAPCNGPFHLWQLAEFKECWEDLWTALKAQAPRSDSDIPGSWYAMKTKPTPNARCVTTGDRSANQMQEAKAECTRPDIVPSWLSGKFIAPPDYVQPDQFDWGKLHSSQVWYSANTCWLRPRILPRFDLRSALQWFAERQVGTDSTMLDRFDWSGATLVKGSTGSTGCTWRVPFTPVAAHQGRIQRQLAGDYHSWKYWKGISNAFGVDCIDYTAACTCARGLDFAFLAPSAVEHGDDRVHRSHTGWHTADA